jgi:hypothetical protein
MELGTAIVGDMNLDGVVIGRDIHAFVLGLLDRAGFELQYPSAPLDVLGDINDDGIFNVDDLEMFVSLLVGA